MFAPCQCMHYACITGTCTTRLSAAGTRWTCLWVWRTFLTETRLSIQQRTSQHVGIQSASMSARLTNQHCWCVHICKGLAYAGMLSCLISFTQYDRSVIQQCASRICVMHFKGHGVVFAWISHVWLCLKKHSERHGFDPHWLGYKTSWRILNLTQPSGPASCFPPVK